MPMKRMTFPTMAARLCLFMACAWTCAGAQAGTWVWLDDSGRKIYSDQPPPSHVPDKRILQQPGKPKLSISTLSEETASPTTPPSPSAPPQPSAPGVADKGEKKPADPVALKRKQEAEKAAEAERQAKEEKRAQVRADNCRRAQSSLATLESGVRLVTTNDKGERVVYDDALRVQEKARLQAAVQENCN